MKRSFNLKSLKEINIADIPLYIYILIGTLIFLAVFLNILPNELLGAVSVCLFMGTLLMRIGDIIPIFNTYFGGAALLPLLVASTLVELDILPDKTVQTVTVFMDNGFLNFYIVSLIVGSIMIMQRELLIKASYKYFIALLFSQFLSVIFIFGGVILLQKNIFEGVFLVGLATMAGGASSAIAILPTIYSNLIKIDKNLLVSSFMAVITIANILAIIGGSLLKKIAKAKPEWSGNGQLLKTSDMSIRKNKKKEGSFKTEVNKLGAGLLLVSAIYIAAAIIYNYSPQIHVLAWTIIIVILIKMFRIFPPKLEKYCINWFRFMAKNFLPVLIAGIGIAYFDIRLALNSFTIVNLFIILCGITGAVIGAVIAAKFLGLYPIEAGICIGLCACNTGSSGDIAVLLGADRIKLLPFASITTRLGGAFMLIWINILVSFV